MNNWVRKVRKFQDKFEDKRITWRNCNLYGCDELLKLRRRLVDEENGEFDAGIAKLRKKLSTLIEYHDYDEEVTALRVEILDTICDSVYILIGTALKLGMDIDGAFNEVHRSNMSKLFRDGTVHYDEGGKVLKGENFKLPELEKYV